jgi:AraC family transcriptional regulator, transcriptional activator of pobA
MKLSHPVHHFNTTNHGSDILYIYPMSAKKSIPIYSIDRFKKKSGHPEQYEIEIFDRNRDFKVTYPHRHDFYEILFITQGNGKHTIDFHEYKIQPNTIFFLSPGQIHELKLSEDIKGYIFLFTSEFYLLNKQDRNHLLELPFFYSISSRNPPLHLEKSADSELLISLFKQACHENDRNLADSPELIRSILDIILIICKRLYPVQAEGSKRKGHLLVKKFKQLIEEKYQENISVKEYAAFLAVTANHLSETVKSITGRKSTDLINDKMILEIKRMLMHTELGVSEIAYQLNFSDQSYFSKYFKNVTGMSPIEFRNKSLK